MSHPDEGDREHETRTLEQLAEDWITLWQTEIAGWMTDPELARMLAAWMSQGAAGWAGAAPGGNSGGTSNGPPNGPMGMPGAGWPTGWPAGAWPTGGWPMGWPAAGALPPHELGPFAAFFRAQPPAGPSGFPPGAASPAAPPPAGGVAGAAGAGDGSAALVEILLRRVAELERRLAGLGPDPAGGAAPAGRPRRVRVKRR